MYVLIQAERGTSATFSKGFGLVGTYNDYEEAVRVLESLTSFYESSYSYREYGDMEAHFKDDTFGEIDWCLFDSDNPEWIKE